MHRGPSPFMYEFLCMNRKVYKRATVETFSDNGDCYRARVS